MTQRSAKIERVRFQILELLRENELHIELQNSFPNPTLYLCENENPNTRDKKKDIDIDHYMCLAGANKLLDKKYQSILFDK